MISCREQSCGKKPLLFKTGVFQWFRTVPAMHVVFNAIVENGCYFDLGAIVTNGIRIPANRYVPVGAIIDTQKKANALKRVSEADENFAKNVVKSNIELAQAYSLKFGDTRCSCGLCCNRNTFENLEINNTKKVPIIPSMSE